MSISFEIEHSRFKFFLRGFVTRKIVCCAEGKGIAELSFSFNPNGEQITNVTFWEPPKDAISSPASFTLPQVTDAMEHLQNQMKLIQAQPESVIKELIKSE